MNTVDLLFEATSYVHRAVNKLDRSQRIRQNPRIAKLIDDLLGVEKEILRERDVIIANQTLMNDSGNE